ncbi:MAG: phage tail family protein [Clostridiales bacterium]|jgi:predicted phage tail component-like protein|nr:phage tail family protein [Clostridiales bacterium]
MLGFEFNGVHSSRFGLVTRSKNRPILPEPKTVTEEALCRDGVYDFSAANPYGRVMYKTREITVDCNFISTGMPDTRRRARAIAAWLGCGEARLVFDDERAVYYMARVSNRIDLQQQISKIGFFTVVFTCRPFAYGAVASGELPVYGAGLCYGDGIRYGGFNRFYADNAGISPCFGGDAREFNAENFGTMYAKPHIVLEGAFHNVRIGMADGRYLRYPRSAAGTLVFDCERLHTVLNGENVTNLTEGAFFELAPGDNVMRISADDIDCAVNFAFRFLYL